MNEKEIIEEMAKDFLEIDVYDDDKCKDCAHYIYNDRCDNDCFAKLCAKYFYNLHYRKLFEGSVVLSKEEYSNYLILKNNYDHAKDEAERLQADNERLYNNLGKFEESVQKKTAKEIFYKLKETLIINNEENTEFFDYDYTLETIEEIAKQYGVEK